MSCLPRSVCTGQGLESGAITTVSANFFFAAFAAGNGRCPAALLRKFTDAWIFRVAGRLSFTSSIAPISHSELIDNSAGQRVSITSVSSRPHSRVL